MTRSERNKNTNRPRPGQDHLQRKKWWVITIR